VDLEKAIREKFELLEGALDERARRLFLAAEAHTLGPGGISIVSRATGLARSTIRRGLNELRSGEAVPDRIRRFGGGRKRRVETDTGLLTDLDALVEPGARGDPESPLRWTIKSVRRLAVELRAMGHKVSPQLVDELLHGLDFSLQANRKVHEGGRHPDRNAQFELINRLVKAQLRAGEPAISVDTKKKELVGNYRNAGREWRRKGHPEEVKVYDFLDPELGKAIPYGVYDLARNVGWVSVGVDHDTAEFAVATIGRWWRKLGIASYPRARRLLILADGGGSNGYRVRLWRWELQKFATASGLTISVSHLPPGTSKWNKIEHRLFSFISQNWRGKPLLTRAAIVSLIGSTTTATGLEVYSYLDEKAYPAKIQVTDEQMKSINIRPGRFHGEWNYTIKPKSS
jgi:DDE family transposase